MSMTNEQNAALRRIKKCLALSASSNEHEAAAALRQAQALMKKYGLTESHVTLSEISEKAASASGGVKIHAWEAVLADTCCRSFGCKALFEFGARTMRGRGRGKILFIGPDARVTVCCYAYESLQRQLRAALKSADLGASTKARQAFCEGWVHSVLPKLDALATPFSDGPLVDEYIRQKNASEDGNCVKRTAHEKGLTWAERAACRQGISAGSDAVLNPAMNGAERAGLIGQATHEVQP